MQIDPNKLVEARLAMAMSQEEAAIASDLSARTIQRIEAGHPASLESTKALLTIFGADIIHDPQTEAPTARKSPWPISGTAIAHASLRSAIVGFNAVRLMLAAIFVLIALAKPFAPERTGLFYDDQFQGLGFLAIPPTGSQDVLGYWISPIMVVAAALVALSFRRVRRLLPDLL